MRVRAATSTTATMKISDRSSSPIQRSATQASAVATAAATTASTASLRLR